MAVNINNDIQGWYFSDEEISNAIKNKLLLNPSIDLTNACNLNCIYCYIEDEHCVSKKKRPNELTLKERFSLIDDLVNAGAKTINIVGAGEPTLDFHFQSIIEYIKNKGLRIVLFTNGIEISRNKSLVDFLWSNNVSIVLKYNSLSDSIQDFIVGKQGYSEVRDNALKVLLDAGFNKVYPTRLGLDTIAFKGIYQELIEIHYKCRELNIFPIMSNFIPTGRTNNGEYKDPNSSQNLSSNVKINELMQPLSISEKKQLQIEISSIDSNFDVKHHIKCAYYGGAKCTQILGLYIDIIGDIYPCVAKKTIVNGILLNGLLGNFRNGDLPSFIWRNNEYLENIRNMYNGECLYKNL